MRFFLLLLAVGIIMADQHALGQEKLDKIILMSGKEFDVEVTAVNDTEIKYLQQKKNKKVERFMDKYRVFSIQYASGTEEIIYKQDTLVGNQLTTDEMRLFIMGEQDAMNLFKVPASTIFGFVGGLAGGYLLGNSFFIFTVPFVFTVLASVPSVKLKPERTRDPKLLGEPTYIMGYERVAKAKKIQNALKASFIGAAIGAGVYQVAPYDQ